MVLDNSIDRTFFLRADVYDLRMRWVNDNMLIDPLVPLPFGNRKALDLCAGTGAVSRRLKEAGWDVVMLDRSDAMLAKVEGIPCVCGDMHNLPFHDKSFALVVCRQGLQYAELDKVFSEIRRVCVSELRLGHITKASGDNYDFWKRYFSVASPGRKHIFEPGNLGRIAEKNGLKIVKTEVVLKADDYMGPIIHLEEAQKEYLINLLDSMPEEFYKMYHIVSKDNKILYDNRWELITLTI